MEDAYKELKERVIAMEKAEDELWASVQVALAAVGSDLQEAKKLLTERDRVVNQSLYQIRKAIKSLTL